MNDSMATLDLFSGIGGFSLGLERTGGFHTVGFCEQNDFCRQVLAKHWPDVPIHEDIRGLTDEEFEPGTIDIICGGYPCTPYSVAGNREGNEADTFIWPEMARLIGCIKPTWVLSENVVGHVSLEFDKVLTDLEGLGYTTASFIIPACSVDARHVRSRLWHVSHLDGTGLQIPKQKTPCGKKGWQGKIGPTAAQLPEWPREPTVGRMAYGVPRRVDRLKALGNSVVPALVTVLGHAILEAHYG